MESAKAAIPTGFPSLNEVLPGGGWPSSGLIEVLVEPVGSGEMDLLMPLLVHLHQHVPDEWFMLVAPPYAPNAVAYSAAGLAPERLLVVRSSEISWVMEQALRSAACRVVLGWAQWQQPFSAKVLRRLQLAAAQSGSSCIVFQQPRARMQTTSAVLRLEVTANATGIEVGVLKSRGGKSATIQLMLQ